MAVKKAAQKTAKPVKKSVKSNIKPAKEATSSLVTHWLLDASLESFAPAQDFAPGERQLEFSVRANQATLPHPSLTRAELRLRAHIHVEGVAIAVAEIKYAAVVEKARMQSAAPQVMAEIYPFGRDALANLLKLAGHQPPLPEGLETVDAAVK